MKKINLLLIGIALVAVLTAGAFPYDVFEGNIVLGNPTDTSITANVLSAADHDAYLEYGTESGVYTHQTSTVPLIAEAPAEIDITELESDTKYYYRMNFGDVGAGTTSITEEYTFYTQRAPGSTFIFGVQGDSHPERGSEFDSDLYDITLAQAKADGVDFYVTSGDDFSIDSIGTDTITYGDVAERYSLQRPHLGIVGSSAPIFLVNGNHEQATLYLYNNSDYPLPNNPAVWAQNARNTYYSQPAPGAFYTGNEDDIEHIGLLRNYFAWEWGDALFVTIDPFWSSPVAVDNVYGGGSKTSDKWAITLGDDQYAWLKGTLENSTATFKFIFAHFMHGAGRGGIENADVFEWGGEEKNGTYHFDTKRPTWEKPIHNLMKDTGVTVFFHAHDHIWVTQELDGVVYQSLPSPASLEYELSRWGSAYSDESSTKLPNTGYARVTVSPDTVGVEYVRTYLPEDEADENRSGEVAYTYDIEIPIIIEPLAPEVTSVLEGTELQLAWNHVTTDVNLTPIQVISYEIWRGETPYFSINDVTAAKIDEVIPPLGTDGSTQFLVSDDLAALDPLSNVYYLVRTIEASGHASAVHVHTGIFRFGLAPGS